MMERVFDSIAHFGREWKKEVCLALGMFDGVHRGHRAVLDLARVQAEKFSGSTAALTFPKHPATLLRPGKEPPLLMSAEDKVAQLLESGLSAVIMQPFDEELSEIPADQFVSYLTGLVPFLRSLCVGENFRFGKDRTGDFQALTEYGTHAGIGVTVARSLILDDLPVSSSRIRKALEGGEMHLVTEMLGRKYIVSGSVSAGKALGRTIGYPTLNLRWCPEAKPVFGVYAGWAEEKTSGQRIPALANYGLRPTVDEGAKFPLLEVHCLETPDVSIWKEGASLTMELAVQLRPEKKFSGVEQLTAQIERDCGQARKLFSQGL
jgi:riboflavin kinase/FMN adenylyltransferase